MACRARRGLVAHEARLGALVLHERCVLLRPRLCAGSALMMAPVAEVLGVAVHARWLSELLLTEARSVRLFEVRLVRHLELVAIGAELSLGTAVAVAVRAVLGLFIKRGGMPGRRIYRRAACPVACLMALWQNRTAGVALDTKRSVVAHLEAALGTLFVRGVGMHPKPWLAIDRALMVAIAAQFDVRVAVGARLGIVASRRSMELLEFLRMRHVHNVAALAERRASPALTVTHLAR